jgi:hypothetical protein
MRNVLPESLGVAEKYFDASELQHLRTVYGINTSKMTESEAKSRLKIIGDIARALSKKKAANDANKKTDSLTEQATKANPDDNPQTKEDAIKSARARALEAIYYQLGGRETTFTGGTREERVRELFSSKYKKTYGAAADTNKKEDIARLKAEIQKILEKENLIAEYRKRYNQDIPTKKQNDVKRIKKEIRKAEQIAEKEKKKVAREERKTALKEAKFSNLFTTNTDKRDMAYTIGVPYNTNFEDTLHNAFSESTRNTQEFFLRIQDNFVIVDNSSQTTQFNTIVHQIHTLEEIMKNGETN